MDFVPTFLLADVLGTPAWTWLAFVAIVASLLAFDLGVLHKGEQEIGVRESLLLSAGYIGAGLLFGAWIAWLRGADSGMEYLTGFLIEKSLSMDNVFVIALIFGFFAIPRAYQHRVLFWGNLGVIVLRAIMIGLGSALVSEFSWMLYLFGAFLLLTGLKMLFMTEKPIDLANDLKVALALVLVFIGGKIFAVGLVGKIPPTVSLTITFGLLLGGVIYSMLKTRVSPLPLR